VVGWFRQNARDLPWRKNSDPYRIWISEIMLQQTQVITVIPYYDRFMKRFPNVQSLAAAKENEVLKLWEGLGYYRRARYLHSGAKMIVEKFDGIFPKTKEELLSVPGIGAYSAGAILSIAYRKATPALDGNLIRVYARFFGIRTFVNEPKTLKKLWEIAGEYSQTEIEDTREFAEGMMEIGALVCTPKNPNCAICPLVWGCEAKKQSLQNILPQKLKLDERLKLFERIWVYENEGKIALLKKGADPKFPHFNRLPYQVLTDLKKKPDYRYSVTNRDFAVEISDARPAIKNHRWVTYKQIEKILLPAIDRRILKDYFKR
jgi:A/G-specific adenine glycosylase